MSVTEDSVTDLMADYLRNSGIKAVTQISESFPSGRSQPDLEVTNGGLFWGEAKWEKDKWEGFGEARDYGQLPGAAGAFLISYPDAIKQKGIDKDSDNIAESTLGDHTYSCAFLRRGQKTDMRNLSLEEIPEWIESNIKAEQKPTQEPSEVIDILRQMARRLNQELQAAPEENLFRNVLGTTTDDEEEREAARETAGFLLVNQLTFYRVLSAQTDEFPEIKPDELDSPRELSGYFERVLERDYTPVFQFRIAEDLPESSLEVLRDTIKSIYGLSPERINHDVLGKVFHELIPEEPRKKIAAYYTQNEPADLLARLAIDDADDQILDPACGSGTLLAASYLRKRELADTFTEDIHRQFLEDDITGIDVMPFAAHLSCIHLALQAPVYETDEVNIGIADSTDLKPGKSISPLSFVLPESAQQRGLSDYSDGTKPDISDEEIEGGSITVDAAEGQEMELGHADVVIMNPPFSRQESVARFSPDYKEKLKTRFDSRRDYIHGKMSYYPYFFFLADKFLNKGGRIAAVVPVTLLNKSSDYGLRKMLLEEYDIEYIFAREDTMNYSEDTYHREVLIVAKKDGSGNSATAFVSHSGLAVDGGKIERQVEQMSPGDTASTEEFTIRYIPADELNINNLFSPFSLTNHQLFSAWDKVASGLDLTPVDELDVGLIRGIGSAGNGVMHVHPECSLNDPDAYLFRDRDVWVTDEEHEQSVVTRHRHTGDTVEIPRDALSPNLRRFTGRKRIDLSGIPEYVVTDPDFDGVDFYMSLTDEEEIPQKWPDRVQSRLGHLSLVRRVYLPAPGTVHLAYYSDQKRLYPDTMWVFSDVTADEAKVLSLWFDSTFGWLQSLFDRVETGGGYVEWHKYVVQKFQCPNIYTLSEEERRELLATFEEVRDADAPSLVTQLARCADSNQLSRSEIQDIEQEYEDAVDEIDEGYLPRRKMDKAILDLAGVPEDEQNSLLDGFYADMLLELTAMKELMD